MTARSPNSFRHVIMGSRPTARTVSERSLQTFPPERFSDLVHRRGGVLSLPGKLTSANKESNNGHHSQKLTKLLLNVNMEGTLGAVQVIMSPENTVRDLIKAAIEIYVQEKRRPLLQETDPDRFRLHYSQFSLQSLSADDKLINLGSRNFFLCVNPNPSSSKPISSACCSDEPLHDKVEVKSSFQLIKLMDFLL